MGRRRRSKKMTVTVPKGVKVKVKHKKTRHNPVFFEFGGKKRKFHFAIGRKKTEE